MPTSIAIADDHNHVAEAFSRLAQAVRPASSFNLNNREFRFMKMACSELTYNEIADKMCVSPRTVDGYREAVFQKMNVRTRVGMVIKAIGYGLVEVSALQDVWRS